jgi:hypothetical protein
MITRRDIARFLGSLADGTWNQKEPRLVFAKSTPLKTQQKLRAKAKSERDNVMNVFVQEDLLAGVSIMKTVLESSNGAADITFVRDSSFLYGYALELTAQKRSAP